MNSEKPVLRILVVDDSESQRNAYVASVIKATSDENTPATLLVTTAKDGDEAITILRACRAQGQAINVLVTDLDMPYKNGADLIRDLRSTGHTPADLDVILVSTKDAASRGGYDIETAATAWQGGEEHGFCAVYLDDGSRDGFLDVIYDRLRDRVATRARRCRPASPLSDTVLSSEATSMREVIETVQKAAPLKVIVLLTGETGTGKEQVAQRIHQLSERTGPFVALNCGAVPDALFESELFGSVAGAYSGATPRPGSAREADHGTLFLDEIGDLALSSQVKLNRLLAEGKIRPVGAPTEQPVDVRVIAATHSNLAEMVASGKFRSDLFMRLNVISIILPPLRERKGDIVAIASALLNRIATKFSTSARPLDTGAIAFLKGRPWPGNIREMENLLERASILTNGSTITEANLSTWSKDSESNLQYPGIDKLGTVGQRLFHQLFVPVLIKLKNEGTTSMTMNTFCAKVLNSNPSCAESQNQLMASFENHKGALICAECHNLFTIVSAKP